MSVACGSKKSGTVSTSRLDSRNNHNYNNLALHKKVTLSADTNSPSDGKPKPHNVKRKHTQKTLSTRTHTRPANFTYKESECQFVPRVTSEQKNAIKMWLHNLGIDTSPLLKDTKDMQKTTRIHVLDDPMRNGTLFLEVLSVLHLASPCVLQVHSREFTLKIILHRLSFFTRLTEALIP